MKWSFRKQKSSKHAPGRSLNRKRHPRKLSIDHLESRQLLDAAGFLQGVSFIDANGDSKLDAAETRKVGATIELRDTADTFITSTTTDAEGYYRFDGLNAGTYRLVELPTPGYANQDVQILSQLNPATRIDARTIEVSVVEPSQVRVNFDFNAWAASGQFEELQFSFFGGTAAAGMGQLPITLQRGLPHGNTPIFNSFCVNAFEDLTSGVNNFPVLPDYDVLPGAGNPHNWERIAYLFNHYATTAYSQPQPLSTIDGAAMQLAIYELLYDSGTDPSPFTTGNLKDVVRYPGSPYTSNAEVTQVINRATFFINDSLGKSEPALYLDASVGGTVTGAGRQSMIATESYNFANFPANPAVDIVKLTNGTDNNSPTGPVVPVGSRVTFTYIVTNPGDVPLGSVTVTDDQGVLPLYQSGDADGDTLLDVTETWTYTATTIATPGQYVNNGTVTGNPVKENGDDIPFLSDVTDTDIDHHYGALPGVNIVKLTNGTDNNSPTGPVVPVGSTVTFTYIVTNTGTVPLASIDVTDDQGVTPVYQNGDTDGDTLLDLTETWTYAASTIAVAGQYINTGTVTGNPVFEDGSDIPGLPDQTDSDIDHHFGLSQLGVISGTKYLDVSGNGLNLTAGPYSPVDTELAGTTIYLDLNNDGDKDAGEPEQVTGPDGAYSFTDLPADTYYVREVVPTGFIRTGPALTDVHVVNLPTGGTSPGNDFANAEKCEADTVYNVSFKIVHPDGTSEVVTDLRGQTMEGDLITATFFVDADAGQHVVSFVSYTAPEPYFNANTASQQEIYEVATGTFANGGPYTLTVTIPNSYYQVDLVCGEVIDQLGPAGSNIFYTPQMRLESADNGGTHARIDNPGSISGVKYNDLNGDGDRDAGEPGLKDWVIFVDQDNDGVRDANELATVTKADGSYKISNLAAGTYTGKVKEVMQAGWTQTEGPGAIVLTAGENETGVNFGNKHSSPGTVSGYKFNDRNADGEWDKNGLDNCWGTADDERGLANWKIFADYDGDGAWDSNEPYDLTDSNGYYKINGVNAGTWAIDEVMQTGWIRTTDDRMVTLTSGESETNVNFGNFQGNIVMTGDTATVGFWKGANGQKLIKKLNGGGTYGTATALGNWLASNFGEMYGSGCGSNNLAGKTNAQIASYFYSLATNSSKQLEAQVLATVLAVYVTDSDWAGGTYAAYYGFNVTNIGVKNDYYNIGDNGAAFGVTNDSALTVWDILQRTNARARDGVLWYGYSSTVKTMAKLVYTGINAEGGITG